jgi:hypothetical protein
MRKLAVPLATASVLFLGIGCGLLGTSTPAPTNTPPPVAISTPVPTPDIEATAQAGIQAELPTPTLTPTPVPIVHLDYDEALSRLTVYLLGEISLISLIDTRDRAEARVRDWVVRGFRRENTWFLAGPGVVEEEGGADSLDRGSVVAERGRPDVRPR